MCVFGVRRPLNKQVLPRRTLKPPRQSEGLGIWTSSLNHMLGSPRCRVLKSICTLSLSSVTCIFFLLLLPCHFFLNFKYTHTSTTVVISGNNTQYWWWWTLKEHGPMGMKKKKRDRKKMLQQTIKIEQCIIVMLYLEKQMYMSTQQKRAKKKTRVRKKLAYKVRNAHFVTTVRYLLFYTCNLKTQCHNCNSLKLKKKKWWCMK